jgi:hypothetical protein
MRNRKNRAKSAVARHRTMSAKEADRCERAIETITRREGHEEIAEQVEDMPAQERGTWSAIDSWWGEEGA